MKNLTNSEIVEQLNNVCKRNVNQLHVSYDVKILVGNYRYYELNEPGLYTNCCSIDVEEMTFFPMSCVTEKQIERLKLLGFTQVNKIEEVNGYNIYYIQKWFDYYNEFVKRFNDKSFNLPKRTKKELESFQKDCKDQILKLQKEKIESYKK